MRGATTTHTHINGVKTTGKRCGCGGVRTTSLKDWTHIFKFGEVNFKRIKSTVCDKCNLWLIHDSKEYDRQLQEVKEAFYTE